MMFQNHISSITPTAAVHELAGCTTFYSTTSSMDIQGVSLSTTSSVDVQGVGILFHRCSADVQGVPIYTVMSAVWTCSSVADPGCLSRIRIFSIPDPGFASENLSILAQKMVSKLSEI
jgi:hypothetical protein